jgi:hypothetical protein
LRVGRLGARDLLAPGARHKLGQLRLALRQLRLGRRKQCLRFVRLEPHQSLSRLSQVTFSDKHFRNAATNARTDVRIEPFDLTANVQRRSVAAITAADGYQEAQKTG